MANYYLCQYETVIYGGPVRVPAGVWTQLRPNGILWGSIDLSLDGKGAGKNWAFLATAGTLTTSNQAPKIVSLGTEATAVNQAARNRILSELGVTVTGTTIAAVVEEVLVSQGLAVKPGSDGMVRIYLGPVLLTERAA